MKTLLRQQHSPTTDETQEKFLNRCFLHQKDTLPSLITMILRIHDLIQWSTPLQQSHKKQILAIDFHSTRQLVKYIYGLESTMVKLYYSILVFMTQLVLCQHISHTLMNAHPIFFTILYAPILTATSDYHILQADLTTDILKISTAVL